MTGKSFLDAALRDMRSKFKNAPELPGFKNPGQPFSGGSSHPPLMRVRNTQPKEPDYRERLQTEIALDAIPQSRSYINSDPETAGFCFRCMDTDRLRWSEPHPDSLYEELNMYYELQPMTAGQFREYRKANR